MGGDGGVIASNRRFMRGAGAADHTADAARRQHHKDAEAAREHAYQTMTTCAVTGTLIDFRPSSSSGTSSSGAGAGDCGGNQNVAGINGSIVACPYGRLYTKEAAVEALIRRKQQQQQQESHEESEPEIGWHVRGLKDLYPVRFQVSKNMSSTDEGKKNKYVPVCPITGLELNGQVAAFLIVSNNKNGYHNNDDGDSMKGKKGTATGHKHDDGSSSHERESQPNVLSEKAIKEMGLEALQGEYGPFDEQDMIRLAPPAGLLDEIKEKLHQKREQEKLAKKNKKKSSAKKEGKKRKSNNSDEEGEGVERASKVIKSQSGSNTSSSTVATTCLGTTNKISTSTVTSSAVAEARKRVEAAVASNTVLSSLFTSKQQSSLSTKEKKDNLFAR